MAKIEITKTELVWPGKYDDNGRLVEPPQLSLPFRLWRQRGYPLDCMAQGTVPRSVRNVR